MSTNNILAIRLPLQYLVVLAVRNLKTNPDTGNVVLYGDSLLFDLTGAIQPSHFKTLLNSWIGMPMLWGQLSEIPIPSQDYVRLREPVPPVVDPFAQGTYSLLMPEFHVIDQYSLEFAATPAQFKLFKGF